MYAKKGAAGPNCGSGRFNGRYSARAQAEMIQLAHAGEALALHARMFPDKVGARDLERVMTFRVWHQRACRLANALLGIGLAKGDRICVLAYNSLEWVEIYAATAMAGLIAVPINFRLIGPEIRYIVEN